MNNLNFGFTTGSCAAAGTKAAVYMLLTGKKKNKISIITPKGFQFDAEIVDIVCEKNKISCAVIKNGGDDPDITTGCHIVSTVSLLPKKNFKPYVIIDGGIGVGRITKPGLDQKIGSAAINHVPRQMIEKEVLEVCNLCDYQGGIFVQISVPEGEEIAKKTFNPRLGIEGGISILGTSGVVEPMSTQAIKDTIKLELNQRKTLGFDSVVISPGNYGQEFLRKNFSYDLEKSVKCSNFIGDTIETAIELGFKKILLVGHIGKLIKLSGGIFDTHSKNGDCRMELLVAAGVDCECDLTILKKVLKCVTTDEAIKVFYEHGIVKKIMDRIMNKIMFNLEKKSDGKIEIGCIVFSTDLGLLGQSDNAFDLLKEIA